MTKSTFKSIIKSTFKLFDFPMNEHNDVHDMMIKLEYIEYIINSVIEQTISTNIEHLKNLSLFQIFLSIFCLFYSKNISNKNCIQNIFKNILKKILDIRSHVGLIFLTPRLNTPIYH
ncbi:hypothetical protein DQF64_05345 [Moraxella bovis]|nr:hypothetical protein DQF64_05345 [Moraxella bovis]